MLAWTCSAFQKWLHIGEGIQCKRKTPTLPTGWWIQNWFCHSLYLSEYQSINSLVDFAWKVVKEKYLVIIKVRQVWRLESQNIQSMRGTWVVLASFVCAFYVYHHVLLAQIVIIRFENAASWTTAVVVNDNKNGIERLTSPRKDAKMSGDGDNSGT